MELRDRIARARRVCALVLRERFSRYRLEIFGRDCDGGYFEEATHHWSARGVRAELDHQTDWADGPFGRVIVDRWKGREIRI